MVFDVKEGKVKKSEAKQSNENPISMNATWVQGTTTSPPNPPYMMLNRGESEGYNQGMVLETWKRPSKFYKNGGAGLNHNFNLYRGRK